MDTWKASLSILQNPAVVTYLLKGVAFTLVISVAAVALGLLLGSVLALARNYCTRGPARVCKWLAVGYIELFRNTPCCCGSSSAWSFSRCRSCSPAGCSGFRRWKSS